MTTVPPHISDAWPSAVLMFIALAVLAAVLMWVATR